MYSSVRIGDIGEVVTGRTPKTSDEENYGSEYMFIGPGDLHQHFLITSSAKSISSKGFASIQSSTIEGFSILVGCIGWDLGNVGIIDTKCATNQQINSITKIKDEFNGYYIYYWLKTKKDYIFQIANVTRTPILNKSGFSDIEINIPAKKTQDQIASFLCSLDAKIKLNNKINTELEAMAKLIYDYWFVQFDFPDKNGKPYKTSGGKMVYNKELKRDIPEGWEVKNINEVIAVKDGTHDSPKSQHNGFKLITSKHLKQGGLDFESANFITEEDYININKRSQVNTGDILFSMIGNIGTVYKIEEKTIDFAIKNVALYKTSTHLGMRNYVYMYLRGYDMLRYMGNVITGSIQKFIGLGSLRKMPLMNDSDTISKFEEKTKFIFKEMNVLKVQNQKLAELRDWLLPMLMNGQVRVGEVEEKLGMVAEDNAKYGKA